MSSGIMWHGIKVEEHFVEKADATLFRGAQMVRNDIIADMKKAKTGAELPNRRKGTKKKQFVRRSAASESPAVQRGDIVKTVDAVKIRKLHYRVGAKGMVAYWLEVGTKKILPRPWLRVAIRRNRKKIMEKFRRGI